ncbi:MAG: hypothetical protein LBC99_04075 [Spirochaetota bacterium]|jgi:transposase|nr:hypothetical protein [Spirochaetota bacterium]
MEEEKKRRFVGIDLGKREYTLAILGRDEKMRVHHGKTSIQGREALYRLLEPTDKIALEAGNLAFILAREIQERVGSAVRVLNAAKLPFIWDTPTKTDKEDAMKLAHLVEERKDEKLPIVPLPSTQEMERRKILASYQREMGDRTKLINRLHGVFVHQGHTTVVKKNLATMKNRQEAIKVLDGMEREAPCRADIHVCTGRAASCSAAEWILKYLEMHEQRIQELRAKIYAEAQEDEDMQRLQSIAGVGAVVAYAFVAHVGDGSRFSKGGAGEQLSWICAAA